MFGGGVLFGFNELEVDMTQQKILHLAEQIKQLGNLKNHLARVPIRAQNLTLKGRIRGQIAEIESELTANGVN